MNMLCRAKTEEEQHQPRVGDGHILGSPKSKEPAPVILENGEPLPVDEEEVAKHQKQLEEKQAQRSARHENAHSDEFALSGDDKDKSARGSKEGKGKGGKDEKPVYVDAAPLAALFQVIPYLPLHHGHALQFCHFEYNMMSFASCMAVLPPRVHYDVGCVMHKDPAILSIIRYVLHHA